MRQRPVPIVGGEAMLTPTRVEPVVVKAVFWSRSRLVSVSNVRAGAESRPIAVASVWGLAGPKRSDPAHTRHKDVRMQHREEMFSEGMC